VVATAAGWATSSSSWSDTRSSVVIDVNASVQTNASSSAYGAEADTPQLKPVPIGDGLSTVVTVSSPQQSKMTVTGLVPTATGSTGKCGICSVSKAASWSITVQRARGQQTVYDFATNGGTFTAVIPAGSTVTVSWQAEASAYAYGPVGYATATASVYGQVKFQ
jgi:acyl dehydratase